MIDTHTLPAQPVNPDDILGYVNRKTGVLFEGETEMLTRLSDPWDNINQGRLETFPDTEEGELDWISVTDEDQWNQLMAEFTASHPEPDSEKIVIKEPVRSTSTKPSNAKKGKGAKTEFG